MFPYPNPEETDFDHWALDSSKNYFQEIEWIQNINYAYRIYVFKWRLLEILFLA